VWQKVAGSRKSIGLLLMDQSVIAGIGNIYRAEVLFKVRAQLGGLTVVRLNVRPRQPTGRSMCIDADSSREATRALFTCPSSSETCPTSLLYCSLIPPPPPLSNFAEQYAPSCT
jgi:hypothetical protein